MKRMKDMPDDQLKGMLEMMKNNRGMLK